MSDELDREAEKEKLRQQLAEEEEDRRSTQRMSELLLKGATMTNRHCENCGDPLFRHEGREFCPTCGWEPGAAGEAGGGGQDDAGDRGAAASEAASEAGGEATVDGGATAQSAATPRGGPAAGQGTAGQPPTQQPGPTQQSPASGEADLRAAREALARTVTALVREAEATTDVGRTRELLAAVREGAEALRALDSVDR